MRSFGFLFTVLALGCSGSATGFSQRGDKLDECEHGTTEACVQPNREVGSRACKPGVEGYVWGSCEPASCTGSEQFCVTQEGEEGLAACQDGKTTSACAVVGECHPGQWSTVCPGSPCKIMGDTWAFGPCGNGGGSASTPLVLAFDGKRVSFTRAEGSFDLFGHGTPVKNSWVGAETPWLALDRNENGVVDDGRELFGSMTELPDGTLAPNGFAALAALDDNGDGWITSADDSFDKLLVWRDRDQDRRSSSNELTKARDTGLVAIALWYSVVPRCTEGDCEMERARFVYIDGGEERRGDVVDVHVAAR
jgi:hypothetical protein